MLSAMHSYAAFLGNNPMISAAELSALLPDLTPQRVYANQILTFQTKHELDQDFLNTLGGTMMIAKSVLKDEFKGKIQDIPTILAAELASAKGKVTFSLRFVGVPPAEARHFFTDTKQFLKSKSTPSRYVGNEMKPPMAIQLHDEGLLDPKKGCELTILKDKETTWIGRTVAAQNIKAYTARDMNKPVRDMTVGILPPKLAQMLLSFGYFLVQRKHFKMPSELTVFDPFCGTGVIPIEAMLRKWHVLASDKEAKAVSGTEKNAEWVRKTYKVPKKDVDVTVWKQDATKPFELKEPPHMIVTEGSLGPNMRSRPMLKDIERHEKNAEALTEKFIENCAKTLPGVPVVMTWPVWYSSKRPVMLGKALKICEKLGYKAVLPPHATGGSRNTLLYRRPDQFVGREIVLLEPTKSA
jgi:hypothetical protein